MKKYAYEFSGPKFTNPCIPLALGCLNVRMEEEQEFYASRTSSPGEENIRCGEEVCLTLNVPYLLDPFFLQIYPLRKWPASSVAIPLVGGNPNPSGRSRHQAFIISESLEASHPLAQEWYWRHCIFLKYSEICSVRAALIFHEQAFPSCFAVTPSTMDYFSCKARHKGMFHLVFIFFFNWETHSHWIPQQELLERTLRKLGPGWIPFSSRSLCIVKDMNAILSFHYCCSDWKCYWYILYLLSTADSFIQGLEERLGGVTINEYGILFYLYIFFEGG